MPRVGFSAENKVATKNYDFPKLKLKVGERARILVGLEDPLVEYAHTLQKPQIVNGVPTTKNETNEKTNVTRVVNVMDFVTRALCLGDPTILDAQGSDPKNCPMCQLAKEHPDMTKPPQRRYAMHVVRYRTKGGSTDIQEPFSAETLVWAFTDQVFNKIIDAAEEWGDLRKHDLLLGPCQAPEYFQKFDISVAAKAAWLESPERKQFVVESFKNNKIPDLTIALGSAKQKQWVLEDIQAIMEAWAEVNAADAGNNTDLDTDLSTLLSSKKVANEDQWADGKTIEEAQAEKEAAAPEVDFSDLAGDLDTPDSGPDLAADLGPDLDTPEPVAEAPKATRTRKAAAPKEEPAAPAAPAEDEPDNFDDLLADM